MLLLLLLLTSIFKYVTKAALTKVGIEAARKIVFDGKFTLVVAVLSELS